jgi:hypothetical protein
VSTYEFFLGSKKSVVRLELLQISHPAFSKTYYLVRNALKGVTVTLENSEEQFFEYVPLAIKAGSVNGTLDSYYDVTLGDLGEIIPMEIDAIEAAGQDHIHPVVVYREYRSDNLTQPMFGPIYLQATQVQPNADGTTTFRAEAPRLNLTGSGRLYNVTEFPMLRGFL